MRACYTNCTKAFNTREGIEACMEASCFRDAYEEDKKVRMGGGRRPPPRRGHLSHASRRKSVRHSVGGACLGLERAAGVG